MYTDVLVRIKKLIEDEHKIKWKGLVLPGLIQENGFCCSVMEVVRGEVVGNADIQMDCHRFGALKARADLSFIEFYLYTEMSG